MKIYLKDYVEKRDHFLEAMQTPGPVVTISREYGCGGLAIADELANRLTLLTKVNGSTSGEWKCISRQIITESASILDMAPAKVEQAFSRQQRGFLEDIFVSLDPDYGTKSAKIFDTVKKVISDWALHGNVVILGMGGAILGRDIERSVHVRLIAPLDWRVRKVYKSLNMSIPEAKKFVQSQDRKRTGFRQSVSDDFTDHTVFDLTLNRMTMTDQDIIETIKVVMKRRKLI